MDKQTKWLRLQVPTALYNELVSRAKADDRELPTFLRRHLEQAFPLCSCGPDPSKVCHKCAEYVYHGMEIHATGPSEKYQIQTADKGLTGVSVHGTSSCEGGGNIGPCGMDDCTYCNPPKVEPRDPDPHCPTSTDSL